MGDHETLSNVQITYPKNEGMIAVQLSIPRNYYSVANCCKPRIVVVMQFDGLIRAASDNIYSQPEQNNVSPFVILPAKLSFGLLHISLYGLSMNKNKNSRMSGTPYSFGYSATTEMIFISIINNFIV